MICIAARLAWPAMALRMPIGETVMPPGAVSQSASPRQRGFTLLAVLGIVAISSIALAVLGNVWHTSVKREKEAELLFIGDQYRRAIASYHKRSPGGLKSYPKRLEDLLDDRRFPSVIVRHLRRLYPDPMTGDIQWGVVKAADGGIRGICSLSNDTPLKQAGFNLADSAFEKKQRYRQWVFMYTETLPLAAGKTPKSTTVQGAVPTAPRPKEGDSHPAIGMNKQDSCEMN